MLTLLATCLLAAGTTFTPLPAWTITEIVGGGQPQSGTIFVPHIACTNKRGEMIPCPEPNYSTRITMQRALAPGQVADAPQGCALRIQGKE